MPRRKKPGPKKLPAGRKKKIMTVLMPPDLLKALSTRADRMHLSRNKLIELFSRDYLTRSDKELRELVDRTPDEDGEGASDLFD